MTTVVLCMAGRYRRFAEAGYTRPKFLLPFREQTLLANVVLHLPTDQLLLIANRRDQHHEAEVQAAAPQAISRWIGDTSGQAETAAVGAQLAVDLGWSGPLVFHNIDTIIEGRDLEGIGAILEENDGFIDVFPETSAAYSYVSIAEGTEPPRVLEIAEKIPISPWATTGLYGFRSPEEYLRWTLLTQEARAGSRAEFYISDVYRTILEEGGRIVAPFPDPTHRTCILGTPSEYEDWVARSSG